MDQDKIRALADFRNALRRFLAFSEEAAGGAGVTALQYQAMLAIKACGADAMPLGDLARELLLRSNAAVQMVDRLAAIGMVERVPSTTDRRSVNVALTEKGEALVLKLVSLHIDQLAKRKKQFADLLRQLKQTQVG